jgi:hypothetical protein
MAVNLIELVIQYLTPERIERIAAAFNLDQKTTQNSMASQPGRAQKVADAVKQQAGALDNLSSAIGGSSSPIGIC